MITFCVSTYNNLEYLKWCIKSVKENAHFNTAPFIVHAENCTDGTNEWLEAVKDMYKLEVYIEPEVKPARGIGGGMNFCADKVKTEYIIFLQSDFYVARDFDLILLEEIKKYNEKHVISSWRVQPNIFSNPPLKPGNIFLPLDLYGAYHNDFEPEGFLDFADEFSVLNDIQIRRGEGAGGFIIKKEDWDYIGGNDSLFAPTSWDDMDLFIRMQNEGFEFIQTTKSVIWHFAGRGSHRLEENNGQSSQRQKETEQINANKFYHKWGQFPEFDQNDFVKPILSNKNRMTYDITNNTSYHI
jgi:glycosyltransferase involved in cell wall biosynthesis